MYSVSPVHYLSTVHTIARTSGRLTSLQAGVITEADAEEFARVSVVKRRAA